MNVYVRVIEKNGELHKGLIFLAKIAGGAIRLNAKKHKEYRYINELELDGLIEEECVSDMKDTLRKAFLMIKENGDGK